MKTKYLTLILLLTCGIGRAQNGPAQNDPQPCTLQDTSQNPVCSGTAKKIVCPPNHKDPNCGMDDDEGPADKDTLIDPYAPHSPPCMSGPGKFCSTPVEVFDTIHVTRAQWEAAQALYTVEVCISKDDCHFVGGNPIHSLRFILISP